MSSQPEIENADPNVPSVAPRPRLLLSVEAAAQRLSISRTRMYDLIKTGRIPSVRVGRLRRVPADALVMFTAQLLAEQTESALL